MKEPNALLAGTSQPKIRKRNSSALMLSFAMFGLVLAVAVALVVAWVTLSPPPQDLQVLTISLLVSGSISVVLGALAFRLGLGTRVPSLAVSLALVYLVGVGVVAVNIIYTSVNMFLSKAHDLPLLSVLLVFSAVISLFFAILMAQSIVSRLRMLLSMARRVAGGDLTARVEVNSRDEIGRLSSEFNSMVERLEEMQAARERLETSRRELIAAVSHDLRTPLASMRVMVEALNDGVVTDSDTVQRYLHTIQSETQHLATLIDDLFELSQIDAGALRLHLEPTSLEDLVSDALESMRAQAQEKNVRLEGQVEGTPPRVPLDAPRMQRVLYNLIQNAIRHTPSDGTITLTVRGGAGAGKTGSDGVELTVADTGEGIPQADLPYIFDRFYRGQPARTRDQNATGLGAGLGLAIAKGIVEAHDGTIRALSTPGQGTMFRIVLPSVVSTARPLAL
jgi:signal transduction histidine kinase